MYNEKKEHRLYQKKENREREAESKHGREFSIQREYKKKNWGYKMA